MGARVPIDAHVMVGAGVTMGDDCRCLSGRDALCGHVADDRVRVHAGARLGSDGFGYVFRAGADT